MSVHLTNNQRTRALERYRDVLAAWRNAVEQPLDQWTFAAPGASAAPFALGDRWPVVDKSIANGPVILEAEATVAEDFAGRPLELELDAGGEALVRVWLDDREVASGGLNPYHRSFPLAERARGGERVRVRVEVVPKGLFGANTPDPRLGRAHLVAPERQVRALHMDYVMLLQAARVLGEHDAVPHLLAAGEDALAVLEWPTGTDFYHSRIHKGAVSPGFVAGVWNVPDDLPAAYPLDEDALSRVGHAQAALKRGLERVARLYPPDGRLAMSGHAHLDLGWLWPTHETRRKGRRTFHTVLRLMEQYRDFTFNQSSAQLYAWIERDEPELFARIAERVREGRIEAVGGMWVEPDCQVPSGESLARQLLYGQRYFSEKFGTRSTVAWLPDTFGFSPVLPQLLNQAGITGFYTQKMTWNETTDFPYDLFLWEGLDGSRVVAHSFNNPHNGYNGAVEPQGTLATWRNFKGKRLPVWREQDPETLFTFGWGDGGGGPTEEMLEGYARIAEYPALPRLRMARVDEYFASLPTDGLPVWNGELYLELHRGTLDTQSEVKRLMRRAEHDLVAAEALSALASLAGSDYRREALTTAWQQVLLNQFHDILPGSSIREVYWDAHKELGEAIAAARQASSEALSALAGGSGEWLTVANTGLHERPLSLLLPGASGGAYDAAGQPLPTQAVEGGLLVHAPDHAVPGLGLASIRLAPEGSHFTSAGVTVRQDGERFVIENDLLSATIGPDGTIHRLFDRENARDALSGRGHVLAAYEDLARDWEAWDVKHGVEGPHVEVQGVEDITVVEHGPLVASVRVNLRWRESRFTVTYSLRAHSPRLEISTGMDWQERRVLLRALYPVNARAMTATFETAFGAVERPTHRSMPADAAKFEVGGHRWVDLGEPGYGVSLLNDSRYGHSVLGNTLGITLVRGSLYPDPTADRGRHEVVTALYPHAGQWYEAGTVQQALELNSPLAVAAAGGAVEKPSLVRASGLPLMLAALKRAEDDDSLVLRLYEPHGARGTATLELNGLKRAESVNILEEDGQSIPVQDGRINLVVTPFQVITLKLRF